MINGNTRQLAGQFETSQAVLGALRANALYRRPDNYWETIADRYRGMTIGTLDQAARQVIDPTKIVWVVVGDAAEGPAAARAASASRSRWCSRNRDWAGDWDDASRSQSQL